MKLIDPHFHAVCRTCDDYESIRRSGTVAITEPAFWAGFDRGSAEAFDQYFRQLTQFEPRRAAQHGVKHFTWICLNPKEAEDMTLAREVLAIIPPYLQAANVLGVGEIGLNKNSRNELEILEEHIRMAADHDQLILVHTPHLEDKLKGTRLILDAIRNEPRIRPDRVLIDHVEEHTLELAVERGHWAGITVYPVSKSTPQRTADMLEVYRNEPVCVNSAADWGPSDPHAVHKTIAELRARGHPESWLHEVFYNRPAAFLGQSSKFPLAPEPWQPGA